MKKRVESDLRTDFYLRIEAGKDVDEVIKEMGDPGETAASFNEEMEGGEPATPWRFHKIIFGAWRLYWGCLPCIFLLPGQFHMAGTEERFYALWPERSASYQVLPRTFQLVWLRDRGRTGILK